MHSIVRLSLLFALFTCTLTSDVLVYTDSDFETKIKDHEIALVEFYAPWCGHCKRLTPEYEKAATTLATNDPPVALIKVDCTVETATCEKNGVTGYPTLKVFKNGEVAEDYNGPREANGIVNTMRSKAGPAYRVLENIEDYEKFLNNNEHNVVGYFDSDSNSLKEDLINVARQLSEKFRFAYTTSKDILKKVGQTNKILIHQPKRLQSTFEDAYHVVEAAGEQLKTYIQDNIHGLVGYRTVANHADFFNAPTVMIYYNLDYVRDPKGTHYVRNRILKIAKKLADEKLNVKLTVSSINEFLQELNQFGFNAVKKDSKFVIARGPKGEKYRLMEEFTYERLEDFARKLANNELEQFVKSQPIPEQTEDVKIAVTKNFDQLVKDETKDVLIEFYAPWCGHCKSLAPIYDELAKTLKDEKSLVIAKMDATENEVPREYAVRGYPTLYYVPKNDKANPKKYDGPRELDAFIKYLAKESTDGLDGYDRDGNKKSSSNTEL